MFGFLNSTFLFAAAAALIPLIIHLFSKRKVKTIEFSSVRHLKAMQKRQVKRLKIKQLLLLLLRMLIILMVVIAFARPTTDSDSFGSHASVTGIFIFDNSASMNRSVADGDLFDLAKQRVEKISEIFSDDDELYLLPTASNQQSNLSTKALTPKGFKAALDETDKSSYPSDFESIIEQTKEIVKRSNNIQTEIYLVTDNQASTLSESKFPEDLDAKIIEVGLALEPTDNIGITSVSLGGQLILPGHEFQTAATIKNYSASDKSDLIASLFLDGNRVAQADFSLDASDETEITFSRSVNSTGFHQGYIEISDDKFLADNRYYFSFNIPSQFNVLIIDGDNNGSIIELALTPSAELNKYWSVKKARPDELGGINFWEYDVVILSGAPKLNETYISRLNSYLVRGKSLFIIYAPSSEMDSFNRLYSSLSGVTLTYPAQTEVDRAGYYTLDRVDLSHPIFSAFKFSDNKPPEIKFYTLPKSETSDNAKTIMYFSGNRPALVEHDYNIGKVITLLGPVNPYYSELVTDAFWVPLLSRTTEYLAAGLSSYELNLYCGNSIQRILQVSVNPSEPLELYSPDNTIMNLVPQDNQGNISVSINETAQPGIYRIMQTGRLLDQFALNLSPKEADLTSLDPESFVKSLGLSDFAELEPTQDAASFISEFRFGRELWQIFVWLAVIFLAIEMFLSRSSFGGEKE